MVYVALQAHARLQNRPFTEARKPCRRFVEVLNGCRILFFKLREYVRNGKGFLCRTLHSKASKNNSVNRNDHWEQFANIGIIYEVVLL